MNVINLIPVPRRRAAACRARLRRWLAGCVSFAAAREFYRQFEKDAGTSVCRTLSGLDLTTPEGRKALKEGVKAKKCSKYVEAGARTLARMLQKIQSATPAST